MGPQGPLRETRRRFVVGAALADTLRGLKKWLSRILRGRSGDLGFEVAGSSPKRDRPGEGLRSEPGREYREVY